MISGSLLHFSSHGNILCLDLLTHVIRQPSDLVALRAQTISLVKEEEMEVGRKEHEGRRSNFHEEYL